MSNNIQIVRYTPDRAQQWDDFINNSKNGTFLFQRGYMDYHSDRFKDHSLMYIALGSANSPTTEKLIAVLPANETSDESRGVFLYSHQGLTYGGFVLSEKIHITQVGELFAATIDYLNRQGFNGWYYKQVPSVYHAIPAEEDEYWLWRHNATMVACNMMTAIKLNSGIDTISARKKAYYSKLLRQGYVVKHNADISQFWPILQSNLRERYNASPVHTLDEIQTLRDRFPHNITCAVLHNPDGEVIAGTVLFITDTVVRTQYISASHEGKRVKALDCLMLSLIDHYSKQPRYQYFEFGTSMSDDGVNLNEGLVMQKECLGGRSIACKVFSIPLA